MAIDFIGVGAARSGTSWLHEALRAHPDVFVPTQKELHHFDKDSKYARGKEIYENNFPKGKEKTRGEITPRYMLYRKSLERIHEYYSDIKIFAVLRDLTYRAISQYEFFTKSRGKENIPNVHAAFQSSFVEDYIQKSLYADQIENILSIFPEKNVLFLSFERICSWDK
ncbi:sulfotransferase domain-containing protein [Roseobacter weihaiensis]|uniref:sulfotransferase domain-containing protein n=1 Tax=Roseobacter weihaiensis TaxID=2763262 RepID=UPI001D0A57EB|nr:sulfotransferase domain-containing protein [Roseobacter sp. H9]